MYFVYPEAHNCFISILFKTTFIDKSHEICMVYFDGQDMFLESMQTNAFQYR